MTMNITFWGNVSASGCFLASGRHPLTADLFGIHRLPSRRDNLEPPHTLDIATHSSRVGRGDTFHKLMPRPLCHESYFDK